MKLLCEVPLRGVKTFEESQFKWLAKNNNDHLLFTFANEKCMRVFAIRQTLQSATTKAREAQSASLAEPRKCTSSSWNRDASLLAIVVDKRQIYFWEVRRNTFVQFKPAHLAHQQAPLNSDDTQAAGARRTSGKSIKHIAWSKMTDRLAICFASGQILLCNVGSSAESSFFSLNERLFGNSETVLRQIDSIRASEHADLFVCTSVSGELLVMTFDGDTRFYIQSDGCRLANVKFSPLIRAYSADSGTYSDQSLWLAYQTERGEPSLFLSKIPLQAGSLSTDRHHDAALQSKLAIHLEESNIERESTRLIDFYWLNTTRLLACLSTGCIHLVRIGVVPTSNETSFQKITASFSPSTTARLTASEVLQVKSNQSAEMESLEQVGAFKSFVLAKNSNKQAETDCRQSFVLVAGTSHRFYYYEVFENRASLGATTGDEQQFSFDQHDEVDLSEALAKVNLQLERFKWSQDTSLLSVQLTSGHLLVYQARLFHSQLVASHAAKTAYLSAPSEITLLNYDCEEAAEWPALPEEANESQAPDSASGRQSAGSSHMSAASGANAIILSVPFRPSLLAIGPKHLALALNNRVRFYSIGAIQKLNNVQQRGDDLAGEKKCAELDEQEYVTLVVGVSLSSKFVAVLLDDGRVKLHSLGQLANELDFEQKKNVSDSQATTEAADSSDYDELANDERFFPDPTKQEGRISAFTLTEELLVYCTQERQIQVFSLRCWRVVQVFDHSRLFSKPVRSLKPNERGNKFVCLLSDRRPSSSSSSFPIERCNEDEDEDDDHDHEHNVHLYDLFSNKVFQLNGGSNQQANLLFSRQLRRALGHDELRAMETTTLRSFVYDEGAASQASVPTLNRVSDAIWDTDGRTILFIESRAVHVFAIFDHTLEREEPVAIYAASARKPASYATLYVSQGIVSYQTSLGRVINAILETHDDELKLTELENRIKLINEQLEKNLVGKPADKQSNGGETVERVLLGGQLEIMALKLEYLRSILPIYSLPKCRDICEHLTEDQMFVCQQAAARVGWVEQLLWRQLATWSIYSLNLTFALSIYQKYAGRTREAQELDELLEEMRARGLDSREAVKERLLKLLGACEE